ncbi:hypothetical protein MFFC18_18190 [Mariniblastus fucicola]|uniref:Uncharacterized protein n=1 Tax=Mariniblastus fucicola TaxID=980251 RepID=A0A5B9P6R5_9BACT|nr:hypothetical protein MFFC18_18190 [Mariniblastus fucicola]
MGIVLPRVFRSTSFQNIPHRKAAQVGVHQRSVEIDILSKRFVRGFGIRCLRRYMGTDVLIELDNVRVNRDAAERCAVSGADDTMRGTSIIRGTTF